MPRHVLGTAEIAELREDCRRLRPLTQHLKDRKEECNRMIECRSAKAS